MFGFSFPGSGMVSKVLSSATRCNQFPVSWSLNYFHLEVPSVSVARPVSGLFTGFTRCSLFISNISVSLASLGSLLGCGTILLVGQAPQ